MGLHTMSTVSPALEFLRGQPLITLFLPRAVDYAIGPAFANVILTVAGTVVMLL